MITVIFDSRFAFKAFEILADEGNMPLSKSVYDQLTWVNVLRYVNTYILR